MKVSRQHPRFRSLILRESLTQAVKEGIMVPPGLIAHGRGEAFDYLLGERTTRSATRAISAAAALLLTSKHPVISVNGNTAALVGRDIVKLASVLRSPIEINLFHPSKKRERTIATRLRKLGAKEILGTSKSNRMRVQGIASPRRSSDTRGIGAADTILIPLEDGDRAEVLRTLGKRIVAIDLNPLSRTSRAATITIVDNITRAIPSLIRLTSKMRRTSRNKLSRVIQDFDNQQNLKNSIREVVDYLNGWGSN